MKRYSSLIFIVITCLLVLTSCSAPITESNPTPTPTAAPTIAPTPELEPEPTIDPVVQEKYIKAPTIGGLEKEIREKDGIWKVVYIYLEENNYGGVAGEYAGEYKKEVMVTDPETGEVEEVGGLVLKPDIVRWWIELMRPDDRWVWDRGTGTFAIPLDISGMGSDEVIISYGDQYSSGDFRKMILSFNGSLPIVCTALGREDIKANYVLKKNKDGDLCLVDSLVTGGYPDICFPVHEGVSLGDCDLVLRYICFIGDFEVDGNPVDSSQGIEFGEFIYGEKICEANSSLICTDWYVTIYWKSDCLVIKDNLVFICEGDK